MNHEQSIRHLRRANEVAARAMSLGRHPFGAILVAPDSETVLAEQGNVDTVNHAESVLARTAALNYSAEYLWQCTLVTNVQAETPEGAIGLCAKCHFSRLVAQYVEHPHRNPPAGAHLGSLWATDPASLVGKTDDTKTIQRRPNRSG